VGWGDSWLHPEEVIGPAHAGFSTNRLHLYQVFSPTHPCRPLQCSLNHVTRLVDDTQEGFRRHRSTKRQLGKLHSILAEQRRRKESISVILYLDIKNAFNTINHRAIFHVLEAKGFPSEDIALFKRMYTGSFLVMANRFGRSVHAESGGCSRCPS
jgi:hypothetical protein